MKVLLLLLLLLLLGCADTVTTPTCAPKCWDTHLGCIPCPAH